MRPILLFLLLAGSLLPAFAQSPARKGEMPPLANIEPFSAPAPYVTTLPNGLRVLVIEKHGTGLITVQLTVHAGSEVEGEKGGLALMTATLLERGTPSRDAAQIARRIESLGGVYNSTVTRDSATLQLTAPAAYEQGMVELLSDMVRRPTFLYTEIERRRLQMLDDIALRAMRPETLAESAVGRLLFGYHPYGHSLLGTLDSIPRIVRDDLVRFHNAAYRPQRTSLILCGDIRAAVAFDLAKRYFGDWRGNKIGAPKEEIAPPAERRNRIVVIDTPDAAQASVTIAKPLVPRFASEDVALQLLETALCHEGTSRLTAMEMPRPDLILHAEGRVTIRRRAAVLSIAAQSQNSRAGEAAESLNDLLTYLDTVPITDSELESSKTILLNNWISGLETAEGIANLFGLSETVGTMSSSIVQFPSKTLEVTADTMQRMVKQRILPAGTVILIVGDLNKFLPDLKRRFPKTDIQTVPIERLDLNRASLFRESDDTEETTAPKIKPAPLPKKPRKG